MNQGKLFEGVHIRTGTTLADIDIAGVTIPKDCGAPVGLRQPRSGPLS